LAGTGGIVWGVSGLVPFVRSVSPVGDRDRFCELGECIASETCASATSGLGEGVRAHIVSTITAAFDGATPGDML
jgi:hypothetical protein